MLDMTAEAIIEAWMVHKREHDSPDQIALCHGILQSLSQGRPISVTRAAADSGLPLDVATELFDKCCALGADVDSAGNIIGMALSLHPTPHTLCINGHELYAWCALDALFLPGLIGQTVKVKSVCPATGMPINLTVSPRGVESLTPVDTIVSIVVPGVSTACGLDQPGGAQGPACSTMHFFRSEEAALRWLVTSPDVAVLAVEEAWQLADTVWIKPYNKMMAGR